jgi:hypothetical protein
VHRLIAIAFILVAACATPGPESQSDREAALEAMARAFPRDANLYQLASIDTKLARFERPTAAGSGPVTRTLVAFCAPGERGWQCLGPWSGVRVSTDGAVYSALAPDDLDDSRLLAIFGYVGSACSAGQAEKVGVQWSRAMIRSVDREGKGYAVQMAGPKGYHRLMIEPVTSGSCAFELREISALTEMAP